MKQDSYESRTAEAPELRGVALHDGEAPILSTATLFAKRREIAIEHAGELYCLRITRNGKLILTK